MELQPLSHDFLNKTREVWLNQVEDINQDDNTVLPSNYERVLDWFEKTVASDDEPYARPHAVVTESNGADYARALLKITYAQNRSRPFLKLLEIHLEPNLDLDGREHLDSSARREARRIVSSALVKSLEFTFESLPSSKLKVYGRTEQMRALYDFSIDSLEETGALPDGLTVNREGAWLVFDKS